MYFSFLDEVQAVLEKGYMFAESEVSEFKVS